jgi:tRNA-dihydrouridine synthase
MENNFWTAFKKPVISLAPMEDVTDTSFREVVLSISDPDYLHVLINEFTSTDGLCHEIGRPNVIQRLEVNASERKLLKEKNVKLVAQIWGANPEKFHQAAKMIYDNFEFDGIDINMGCPVKKIVKQGGCSALILQPELAAEIIQATKEATPLTVSVKTRIGFNKIDTENWIGHLLKCNPAALTIHGRIQKDQSLVPANWEEIKKSVELRNQINPEIPVYGNGDLWSIEDGLQKMNETGVDGFMIGRGIFNNPWFFNYPEKQPNITEKIQTLLKHNRLFGYTWKGRKNDAIMKRFYKIYINSFTGAAELRAKLMETKNLEEADDILLDYSKEYNIEI